MNLEASKNILKQVSSLISSSGLPFGRLKFFTSTSQQQEDSSLVDFSPTHLKNMRVCQIGSWFSLKVSEKNFPKICFSCHHRVIRHEFSGVQKPLQCTKQLRSRCGTCCMFHHSRSAQLNTWDPHFQREKNTPQRLYLRHSEQAFYHCKINVCFFGERFFVDGSLHFLLSTAQMIET